jgi:hypothetical protein
MSYLARGTAERGAGAPPAGMRPRSRPQGAHPTVSSVCVEGGIRAQALVGLPARPIQGMGIDSQASRAGRRRDNPMRFGNRSEAAR